MDSLYTVTLTGGGPWGIRIQGGKDFSTPLSISRVTGGGKGSQAGIKMGEQIVAINGQATSDLVHVAAQKLIKNTGVNLELTLNRSAATSKVDTHQPAAVTHKTPYKPLVQPTTQTGMAASQYKGKSYQVQTKYTAKEIVNATSKPADAATSSFPAPPPTAPSVATTSSFPPPPEFLKPDPPKQPSYTKAPPIENRPSVFTPRPEVDSYKRTTFAPPPPPPPAAAAPVSAPPTVTKSPVKTFAPSSAPPKKHEQYHSMSTIGVDENEDSRNEYSRALVDEINNIQLSEERKKPRADYTAPAPPKVPPQKENQTPAVSRMMEQNTNSIQSESTSSKSPVCAACGKQIRGKYCQAIGKDWHPECFVCQTPGCGVPLQQTGFIENKGAVHCRSCFERDFAYACAKCAQKIVGDVMHALNQTWHMQCFTCATCGKTFQDGIFHWQNEKPYCVDDYNKIFATFCRGCDLRVEAGDQYIEALGHSWHDNCFTCATCHVDLRNSGFYNRNSLPVCKAHAR